MRLPDLLHASFVRSAVAHQTLREVDVAAACRAPGVAGVLTGADLVHVVAPLRPRLDAPGFVPTSMPALAVSRVRFAGEPLAIVAATSTYAAADACDLVRTDGEPLRAIADVDAALSAAVRLHDEHGDYVLFAHAHRHGDVDGAFAAAAVVVRERFTHARVSASPLEPRGAIARWDGDDLTMWTGSQVPHVFRAALAAAFGLAERRVRVIVPDTGGGFGQKMHVMQEDLAVAAIARRVGHPVKWIETRRENLAAASQAREGRVDIEAAADADGVVRGLRARVYSDAGAYHVYPLTASLEPMGTAGILPGPYRVPAYAYDVVAVATNKPPIGAYRGVGMTMGAVVMERTLDLVAERLGLDPVEVRRRNLLPRDAYPFTSAAGFVYDSGDYPTALELALVRSGYAGLVQARDAARQRGRLVGLGVACYTEYTGIGGETYRRRGMADVPGHEAATVEMAPDGSVACRVSFPSQGQGHATTVAQLVADRLGVPLESVRVEAIDTATAPSGTGTFASRGAVVQGGAVDGAAALVRGKLLARAAAALEVSAEDLEIAGGRISVRGLRERGVPVREIARLALLDPASSSPGHGGPLEATVAFDPPGPAFSGAVHVAHVEVDPETGRVTVRDYALVEDCGPVINPVIVEGQIHGAVAQGIGEALSERLVYDGDAQLLTGTLMDYAVPPASVLPTMSIGHVETPSPRTPGGYKGMGEGGTIGATAAIANAVADAVRPLGIRVTALPISPESLLASLPHSVSDSKKA